MRGIRSSWAIGAGGRPPSAVALGAVLGLLATLLVSPPAIAGPARSGEFRQTPIDTGGADRPFDLGTADIDRDGDLDVYGANHNRRSPLLLNDGEGRLRERLYQRGLAQQSLFPGFEDGLAPASFVDPGLYVFAERTDRIVFRYVGGSEPITGYMRAPQDFFVNAPAAGGAEKRKGRREPGPDDPRVELVREDQDRRYRRLYFRLPPGTELRTNPRFFEFPIEIIVETLGPEAIFLGPERVSPAQSRFTLTYRDRHAYLWGQLAGDPGPDALIVRGGIKGHIDRVPDLISDELLIAGDDGYTEGAARAGIDKQGCRGRGIRPTDLGNDGDIDLAIECEAADPLLFEQVAPGRYRDRSRLLAGIGVTDATLRWVRLRRGGQAQLLAAGEGSVAVFDLRDDRARRVQRLRGPAAVKSVAAADYDGDGDQDLLLAAEGGSLLLRNRGGRYRSVAPTRLGLPRASIGSWWVDLDNDGRLDLHDYQRGSYLQRRDGRFLATGSMAIGSPAESPIVARAIWLDRDNDGDREPVVAEHFGGARDQSRYLAFARRGRPRNGWLAVEVEGRGMGIDALGTEVTVRAGDASRTAWVGESEGSRYSWGDSRLYFGLGDRRRVPELRIRWPGGARTILRDVRANRLLTLTRGSERLERMEMRGIGFELARIATEAAGPASAWSRVEPVE